MYFKLFRLTVNALYFLTHSSDAYFNQADLVEPSLAYLAVPPVYPSVTLSIKILIITLLIWLFLTTHRTYCVFWTPLSSTLNFSFLSDFLHGKFFPESINRELKKSSIKRELPCLESFDTT